MKTLVTFAILILACVLHHYSDAHMTHTVLQQCCPRTSRTCVRENFLKNVVKSNCRVKAILVTNKKNVTLCLDADWDWAQKLLEKFSSTDVETKQMKLDYSECVRNLKKRP